MVKGLKILFVIFYFSIIVFLIKASPNIFVSFFLQIYLHTELPRWLCGKESTCQCRRCGFDPWIGKIPWRRKWQPTPVFLPGESPWTEEPGMLQSMWSQRVGHDQIRSDQISRSVVSNSLQPHELQHARPPCPSPPPGVHSNSRPSSR